MVLHKHGFVADGPLGRGTRVSPKSQTTAGLEALSTRTISSFALQDKRNVEGAFFFVRR